MKLTGDGIELRLLRSSNTWASEAHCPESKRLAGWRQRPIHRSRVGMRILLEGLGFGVGDNFGGSARVAAADARALVKRGHEVDFWCTNLIDKRQKLFPGTQRVRCEGVEVVYFDTTTISFWPGVLGPHYSRVPKDALRRIREFDVVHLTEFRSYLAARVGLAAISADVPLIIQPHGTFPRHDRSRLVKRAYDLLWGDRLSAGAARFLALTQVEAAAMSAAGIAPGQIRIVPNGLDVDAAGVLPARGEFRKRIGIGAEIPLIVSVGRVDEVKGYDLMLRALARIPPPTMYVCVGPDSGSGHRLRSLASELKLTDRFMLMGAYPYSPDVQTAIVDADVFVVPSRYDAFGQVILEACLAGRPMVLSSGCNIASEFADRAALVVPPEADQLANACNRLLTDPKLRKRLGEEGRRMLEAKYRLEEVAARLERIYLEVRSEVTDGIQSSVS